MLNYDKYAPYVFWCYGIAAALLIGVVAWSVLRVTRARQKLDAFEKPDGEKGAAK
ncbi:MAG: heme exporter protein CcmD [Alphaproteobacteria bacterium]|nr:heme exporter protein CcmD [Alphaproteobacteria bacterium]